MKTIFMQTLVLVPLLSGCGKSVMTMKQTLEKRTPKEKASRDCLVAKADVYTLLYSYQKSGEMLEPEVTQLGTTGCAVVLTVKSASKVLDMLDIVRGTSKSYSFYRNKESGAVVNVWVAQKPMEFKDTAGKIVDTSPTVNDCTLAKNELAKLFKDASFRVIEDRKGTAKRKCYVDAVFLDAGHSDNFASYMKYSFPYGNKEPFNWYLDSTDATKKPRVVSIHAVDAYQK